MAYTCCMAIIISADELKKTIPGYDPSRSHIVHTESAKMADGLYTKTIKESDLSEVILLSGGAASGKTEFMSEYLANEPYIIVDGTLPSFQGAHIKAQKALKYGKKSYGRSRLARRPANCFRCISAERSKVSR